MAKISFVPGLVALVATGALAADLPAQGSGLELAPCGGALGKPVVYELRGGKPGFPLLFLTAGQRARIPLALIDPRDPRELGVGLDLLSLAQVLFLDAQGQARFSWTLPNDPNFAGLSLLHQALTYPGATRTFDEVTQVAVLAVERGGQWTQKVQQTMALPRSFHTALPLGDGRHLVAGGGAGALLALTSYDTSEYYDEASRSFAPGPQLTVERGVHTATELEDGRWLLVGGVDKINDPQPTSEFFDPAQGLFVAGPTLRDKRMGHSAVRLDDGRVLVVGGLSDLNNQLAALGSALDTTEIYDPKTNAFALGPKLQEPKAGPAVVALADGRILIAGGVTWRSILSLKVPSISTLCEIFDPKTNTLTPTGSLSTPRALGIATRLPDGRVLFAGGVSGPVLTGGAPTNTAELFDPATGKWSNVGSMQTARGFAPGLWLPDGRFALFGGANGTLLAPVAVAGAEAFDPQTLQWTSLPNLNTSRAASSASAMSACGVLVIGGVGGTANAATRTQEIYLPF